MTRLLMALCLLLFGATARADPAEVRVGAFVTSLSGINLVDGSFRIATYMWFIAPPGTFDAMENLQVLARAQSVQVAETKLLPDGSAYTAVLVEATADKRFNARNYPFDSHVLRLVLESNLETSDVVFVADTSDSRISDVVQLPRWALGDLRLLPSAKVYDTGFGYRTARPEFPRIILELDISRIRSLVLMEKFIGFFLGLVVSCLVLTLPAGAVGTRLGTLTSAIFAAVVNQYRLVDTLTFDGVFGLVDQVAAITFLFILSVLSISIYVDYRDGTDGPALARRLNWRLGLTSIVLHATLLVLAFGAAMLAQPTP